MYSYYLPSLPVIIWTLAVLGWMILVIEAVVASPLWAAAHAVPEGEGIAGQHGKRGYMLLINILLRPSLMVIGFFISYALINGFTLFGVFMLHEQFKSMLMVGESVGYMGTSIPATFRPISFLTALVSTLVIIAMLVTIIIHKSLNLVTWLPENAMKWAGGEGQSLGEQSDERRVAAVFGQVQSQAGISRSLSNGPKMQMSGGGGGNGGGSGKDAKKNDGATNNDANNKADTPEVAGKKQVRSEDKEKN